MSDVQSENIAMLRSEEKELRKIAEELDNLFAEFVERVYAVSGMKRPDGEQATLFTVSEAGELAEANLGKFSPITVFARFAGNFADFAVSTSPGWKRSHPVGIAGKRQRVAVSAQMVNSMLGLVIQKKNGKVIVPERVANISTEGKASAPEIALEAGQVALMAWQSSPEGEEDGEAIPGPFVAVAEWAINLGKRDGSDTNA